MKTFEIENLNLFYGDNQALKDVSLIIPTKKVTAFIGPSGCGKSTLLRVLNRMNDLIAGVSISGKVSLEGSNILGNIDVRRLRMKVGMVFQKANPFPMSIFDNVSFGQRAQGVTDRKQLAVIVEESLKRAALWEEVKDRLNTSALGLSGGQQQRLCIARTIAMKPDIILMDEPTSALDPIATARIEEMMESLRKEFTVVIVTHSMAQAKRIADKTAFFLMGELVEHGDTEQIFNAPQDKRTRGYITGDFG